MEGFADKLWTSSFYFLLILTLLQGILANGSVLHSCSFKRDTCGMINQPGSEARWHRTFLSFSNGEGYAMAVRGNEADNHFARFMMPYFETEGADKGCLQFRYFINGRTPASLAVIKQGDVTQYVFTTARKTHDRWEMAKIDVEFLGEQVLFYFEADTRVQDYGDSMVAFTDLKITSEPCTAHHISRKPHRRRRI